MRVEIYISLAKLGFKTVCFR